MNTNDSIEEMLKKSKFELDRSMQDGIESAGRLEKQIELNKQFIEVTSGMLKGAIYACIFVVVGASIARFFH